jgi:gamma-glutamylcyclotransferase (GGCT)/AIG2-like uncharacterized protein YtfP
MTDARRFRLFVYDTMLPGEPEAALLEGAVSLGPARTVARYPLLDLGAAAALLESTALEVAPVVGELYEVTAPILARCDVRREHPTLFVRQELDLEDGTRAFAYFLRAEQARGRRRIRGGDWKKRFDVAKPEAGPLVRWARSRPR